MAARAEAQSQKRLNIAFVGGFVFGDLINFFVVETERSTLEQNLLGIWLSDVKHGLRIRAVAPKIDFAGLLVGFIHGFLVVVPLKDSRSGLEAGCRSVHL